VFANLCRALAAGGARPEQATKITIFVVNYRREYLPVIEEARVALFGDHKPTDTLLGVAALSRPEFLSRWTRSRLSTLRLATVYLATLGTPDPSGVAAHPS
jgi:hypothetical protein